MPQPTTQTRSGVEVEAEVKAEVEKESVFIRVIREPIWALSLPKRRISPRRHEDTKDTKLLIFFVCLRVLVSWW
jgi:hypothetical protein